MAGKKGATCGSSCCRRIASLTEGLEAIDWYDQCVAATVSRGQYDRSVARDAPDAFHDGVGDACAAIGGVLARPFEPPGPAVDWREQRLGDGLQNLIAAE